MLKKAQASLLNFLKTIRHLYEAIDLFALNLESKKRLLLATNITPEEAYKVLKQENAWWKNKQRNENYYFAPSRKQHTFQWLFLDDVEISTIKPLEAIIVQTSLNKFQAYIKLPKQVKPNELKTIARQAVKHFKADKAVVDPWHLRRLPGLLNTKYTPPYLISWKSQKGSTFNIQAQPRPPQWRKVKLEKKKGERVLERKTWHEFYNPSAPSFSEVDYAFACYLLKLGFEPDEVEDILRQESPDIHKRHPNLKDYLSRTIQAALRRL
jgi:hypothetical protein